MEISMVRRQKEKKTKKKEEGERRRSNVIETIRTIDPATRILNRLLAESYA